MAKAKCHVEFVTGRGGPAAVLMDDRGRSLNVINYPRDHHLTPKAKTAARRRLMRGCQELSRSLGGAKRKRRRSR
jgi:hypothetical protein